MTIEHRDAVRAQRHGLIWAVVPTMAALNSLPVTADDIDKVVRVTTGTSGGNEWYELQAVVPSAQWVCIGRTLVNLPVASDTVLGGIKVGANLSIDEDGVLSALGGGATDEDIAALVNDPDSETRTAVDDAIIAAAQPVDGPLQLTEYSGFSPFPVGGTVAGQIITSGDAGEAIAATITISGKQWFAVDAQQFQSAYFLKGEAIDPGAIYTALVAGSGLLVGPMGSPTATDAAFADGDTVLIVANHPAAGVFTIITEHSFSEGYDTGSAISAALFVAISGGSPAGTILRVHSTQADLPSALQTALAGIAGATPVTSPAQSELVEIVKDAVVEELTPQLNQKLARAVTFSIGTGKAYVDFFDAMNRAPLVLSAEVSVFDGAGMMPEDFLLRFGSLTLRDCTTNGIECDNFTHQVDAPTIRNVTFLDSEKVAGEDWASSAAACRFVLNTNLPSRFENCNGRLTFIAPDGASVNIQAKMYITNCGNSSTLVDVEDEYTRTPFRLQFEAEGSGIFQKQTSANVGPINCYGVNNLHVTGPWSLHSVYVDSGYSEILQEPGLITDAGNAGVPVVVRNAARAKAVVHAGDCFIYRAVIVETGGEVYADDITGTEILANFNQAPMTTTVEGFIYSTLPEIPV